MRFLIVQPRWLMYLMIFVIGCSRVWATSSEIQPMHHAAIEKPASVMAAQHVHDAQAASHTSAMDCHRSSPQHSSDQAAQQATCHQEEGEKNVHLSSSCSDCSPSHCQTLNSGVLQPAFSGIAEVALQHLSCNYWPDQAQHLTGYWQEILRPPRT